MSGGLMGLVACGAQDMYLNNNSAITFFRFTMSRTYKNEEANVLLCGCDDCYDMESIDYEPLNLIDID